VADRIFVSREACAGDQVAERVSIGGSGTSVAVGQRRRISLASESEWFEREYQYIIRWRANLTIIDTDDSPGYLFDENGKPRPIVDTVGNLIHSWTTVGNGITNQQGTLTWKGFSGIYEIQWTGPNNSQETASIHVDQKSKIS
jgi:hypothetical protein